MIGLFSLSTVIVAMLLVNWLTKFELEDDFSERERY